MGKKLNINETNNYRNEKPLFQFTTIISSTAFKIIHIMDSTNWFLSVAVQVISKRCCTAKTYILPCNTYLSTYNFTSPFMQYFWDLFSLNLNFFYIPHNQHIFPFSFSFHYYFINSFRIACNECQSFSPSPHLILSDSPSPSLLTTLSNSLWFFFHKSTESKLFPNYSWGWDLPWSVVDLLCVRLLKKTSSFSSRSYQRPIALHLSGVLACLFPSMLVFAWLEGLQVMYRLS